MHIENGDINHYMVTSSLVISLVKSLKLKYLFCPQWPSLF